MLASTSQVCDPATGEPLRIRIGVNSGRVMSGIVGTVRKKYCVFGDGKWSVEITCIR